MLFVSVYDLHERTMFTQVEVSIADVDLNIDEMQARGKITNAT